MRKHFIVILFLSCFCSSAYAGDEVDYSAPYVTLENGELVTKYPAKEHDPNAPAPNTAAAAPESSKPTPLGIGLVVAMIGLAVFLSRDPTKIS